MEAVTVQPRCCGETRNKRIRSCDGIGKAVTVTGGIGKLVELMCQDHIRLFTRRFHIEQH